MAEKKKMKVINDILKNKSDEDKYSQGRIYLLISIISYYITLAILIIAGIHKEDIKMENFRIIIDALQYAMTLFGGYVFGGKFIDVIKIMRTPQEVKVQTQAEAPKKTEGSKLDESELG